MCILLLFQPHLLSLQPGEIRIRVHVILVADSIKSSALCVTSVTFCSMGKQPLPVIP